MSIARMAARLTLEHSNERRGRLSGLARCDEARAVEGFGMCAEELMMQELNTIPDDAEKR